MGWLLKAIVFSFRGLYFFIDIPAIVYKLPEFFYKFSIKCMYNQDYIDIISTPGREILQYSFL